MVKYPVGGPREPVFALLRSLGFSMSPGLGDKNWHSADGIDVHIYLSGSMVRIYRAGHAPEEIQMDDLADWVAAHRWSKTEEANGKAT